jgi:serine/threonine protein kinase/Tol biopolymer transport system component
MAADSENSDHWNRVEQLFHAALEQPVEGRGGFLDRACGSDADLRRELDSLVRASGSGDALLERPAIAQMGLVGVRASERSAWIPGTIVGHYRIMERLGAGGMGEIFRARDTRLEREVALKTLPPDLSLDRSYLERLRREARSLASVNHPNVATLYEIEDADGHVALVMELVEGETLAKRLSHSRPRIEEILAIATQIAEALEAAHRKGVVHRDLKPDNVMLTRGGLIKVLDFGLAKRGGEPRREGAGGYPGEALTSRGVVLGTAGYMAPEQADGGDADQRSDIFSFGAILYELAAGRPAFSGDTAAQRLSSVLRDEPPPLENHAPDIPKRLRCLIRICLHKNPDDRYQNITDVKFALDELKEDLGHDEAPTAVPAITRRRVIFGGAFAAGGAALSYLGLRFGSGRRAPTVVTPLTMYDGRAQSPALSPDGKMVAFMWEGEHHDDFDLYLKVIGSGEPLRLTSNPKPELTPLWSRDGRFIAFSRTPTGPAAGGNETICIIPVLGGPERTVGTGFANDWSPDGTVFLALVATEGQPASWCLVSAADGSSRRLLTTAPGSALGRGRFSPDGRRVYYIERTERAESRLNELDLAGGAPKRVPTAGFRSVDNFAWAGPNELILVGRTFESVAPRFYRVPASGGVPDPLPFGANVSDVDTFPGAKSLVYSYNELRENIWRVGAWPGSDRQPRRWVASDGWTMNPAVSPAGNRIAFTSSRFGTWTIWASDAEGNAIAPAVRFPNGATNMVGSPAWSPDGSQIAFDVHIGTVANIFVASVGTGEPRRLTWGNGRNIVPAWSPDGRWIYYTSGVTGAETIWRAPAAGGEPRQITRQGGYSVKVSPDGKYLYYLKSSREGELWRASAEGGGEELLVRELKNRNFWVLADGVYLLDPGVAEISPFSRGRARFYRFRTRRVEDLGFETEKPIDHYGICLSPDGKWLYYVQADRNISNLMLVENFR